MIRRGSRSLKSFKSKEYAVNLLSDIAYEDSSLEYMHGSNGLKPFYAIFREQMDMMFAITRDLLYLDEYQLFLLLQTDGGVNCIDADGNDTTLARMGIGELFYIGESTIDNTIVDLFICSNNAVAILGGIDVAIANGLSDHTRKFTLPAFMKGGTLHCGRVFAADMNEYCRLWWSGVDILDWELKVDGAGFIDLDRRGGRIIQVAEFGDLLVCVRTNGLTVVRAMADSRNFRISDVQNYMGTAYPTGRGLVMNGKFWFTAQDGLYSFNGSQVKKEFAYPGKLSLKYKRMGINYGGILTFECTVRDTSYLLSYNPANKDWALWGKGYNCLCIADDKILCISSNNKLCRMYNAHNSTYRFWQSVPIALREVNTLKYVQVDADLPINLEVTVDGATFTYNGLDKIAVGVRGKSFTFKVIGGYSTISNLTAVFEEVV